MNQYNRFSHRHIGVLESELDSMLAQINVQSLEELVDQTIPDHIRMSKPLDLPEALSEKEYLEHISEIASKNLVYKSFIGQGYYGTVTPSVIARNVFQNPGWYTQYTPYQAEISQGRLESLLNYQTMVSDFTGFPVANASLLDEGTAAAEAMNMFFSVKNKRAKGDNIANEFFVSDKVYEQTIDTVKSRAEPLDIKVVVGDWKSYEFNDKTFGILLQYPDKEGAVNNYKEIVSKAKENGVFVTVAADLMSLVLLSPPGEWGADCAVGNTQRFGVPMGFGGPHAAYFATSEKYKRLLPGRIIGVSIDRLGKKALRMALQTREQHIRREKATSNICTAQALLANMAGFYAVYHGPKGLKAIATRIHCYAKELASAASVLGFSQMNENFFDTLRFEITAEEARVVHDGAMEAKMNFYYEVGALQIAIDECTSFADIQTIVNILSKVKGVNAPTVSEDFSAPSFSNGLERTSEYLTHEVFNKFHSETQMMRYIKRLENKDISLVHSMIPLGSCTMKLNAATQLFPVSWPAFADLHPFVPTNQSNGYEEVIDSLEKYLCEITGFTACSLQPNSGAQGEFAGLLIIRAYHQANNELHRNIALIPSSAHGTNPASSVLAGMKVVVVNCDDHGNIDVKDLKEKAELHKDNLSALMVTYPSTHGVFETEIKEVCEIVHDNGGMVYMDGANMNAQVGFTSPGIIGADVCHLNLHKTFAIPHGGGGPGVGPICCNDKLAPYLPNHSVRKTGGAKGVHAVASAPFGSASITLISYAYIRMLGTEGLLASTANAILNANYLKSRLENDYEILYSGEKGRAAHEFILDLRPFKSIVSAEDVAKRLIDYGFHAPTLSFPVAGTLMIEPTESEDKEELDRFIDAMLQIKAEIDEIAKGEADPEDNVLINAPHTAASVASEEWNHPYSREKAVYPVPYLREVYKYWTPVTRVNNGYGDRHLICTCPPIEDYMEETN